MKNFPIYMLSVALCFGITDGIANAELTYYYTPRSFMYNGTTAAWGKLVIADGFGPGASVNTADIVSYEFIQTHDTPIVIDFNSLDGDTFTVFSFSPLVLSDDLLSINSGSITTFDLLTGARQRMIMNVGTVNDNYLVDSGNTADGAYGGAFGGWDLYIPGDTDFDGDVDSDDLVNVKTHFGDVSLDSPGDADADDDVDVHDFIAVKNHFGTQPPVPPPAAAFIPEPTSVILLTLCGVGLIARKRQCA